MANRGTGLMWQIRNPKQSINMSIVEACEHFKHKFGIYPTLVTINIETYAESGIQSDNVQGERMTPTSHIHLWGVPQGE